jgi:hypothetical protein
MTPTPVGTRPPAATRPPISGTTSPFQLELQKVDPLPTECSDSPFGEPDQGIVEVAYVPSGFCFNGEIDQFDSGGQHYIVQSLGTEAAFFITDVTDPTQPAIVGAWQWNDFTYTADVKAFKQGDRRFIVLSMEPMVKLCGVSLVEVTDPAQPALLGLYTGDNTAAPTEWCDTHTTQVSTDEGGNGAFVYVSSIETADVRVLDVRDLSHVVEINHYTHPDAGIQGGAENFVHDSTIVRDRVYLSYWGAGVVILDRQQLEAGQPVESLNPVNSIAPRGLDIHHSYPTEDDQFLFVEDEVNYDGERAQLWLFDIRDLSAPKQVSPIQLDEPFSSPHNLLVEGDLLYVGWYTDGVRVFRYDVSDPDSPVVEPFAFKSVRDRQTTGVFGSDIFDAIYGVRLRECDLGNGPTTCIFASDLTRGLLILALEPTP